MTLQNNYLFQTKKEKVLKLFQEVISNPKLELNTKRDRLKKILEIDNTIEKIIIQYLRIEKEIIFEKSNKNPDNEKRQTFKGLLLFYECAIDKNQFNSLFHDIYVKNSSIENLFSFISLIAKYKDETTIEEKTQIINEVISFKKIKKYSCLVPINYTDNLELYINILNYYFFENVLNYFCKTNYQILKILMNLKKRGQNCLYKKIHCYSILFKIMMKK